MMRPGGRIPFCPVILHSCDREYNIFHMRPNTYIKTILFALLGIQMMAQCPAEPGYSRACSTDQGGCKGVAIFKPDGTNNTYSFTIWKATGGRENFVLKPGEGHKTQVMSGDKWSRVNGNTGVPDNAQRLSLCAYS
jgi:hypothetical protein